MKREKLRLKNWVRRAVEKGVTGFAHFRIAETLRSRPKVRKTARAGRDVEIAKGRGEFR